MSLREQIQSDLVVGMKNREELKVSVLRMLKAAITKFETSGKEKKDAGDEDITQIIGKEIKSRKDSAEQYRTGNRLELATKEEAEIKILEKYLPAQLSEEEIRKIVAEVIGSVGAKSKSDLGKVMGALMPRVKGKADGGLVNKIVQESLK